MEIIMVELKELRLKLIEIVVTNLKGVSVDSVIEVAKRYEDYITKDDSRSIPDKEQSPGDNQKEGRIGQDVPAKKKPR